MQKALRPFDWQNPFSVLALCEIQIYTILLKFSDRFENFSNRIFFQKRRVFDWDMAGRIRRVHTGKKDWKSKQVITLDFWECSDFDANNQLTDICIQSFSLSAKFLLGTLTQEVKPVFTEKHHFDNRGESFLHTFSGNFGPSKFWCMDQNRFFVNGICIYKSMVFNSDFD